MLRPLHLNTTICEEKAKLTEEFNEFKQALIEGDEKHIIEEFYDMVQVAINLMDKQDIDITDIIRGEGTHFLKMIERGHKIKMEVKVGDYVVYDGAIVEVAGVYNTHLELLDEQGNVKFMACPYDIERLPF